MSQEIIDCLNFGRGEHILTEVLEEKVLDFINGKDGLQKISEETELSMLKMTEVPGLPLQDAFWSVEEIPLKHHDLTKFRMLVLSDTSSLESSTIHFTLRETTQISFEDQLLQLLSLGCLYPLDGRKSRRPRFLYMKVSHDFSNAIHIQSDKLGIQLCGQLTSEAKIDNIQEEFKNTIYFRQCSVCGISGSSALFDECDKCGAVLYCSERCKTEDWLETHQDWCLQFTEFMAEETELADLPFDFVSETTGRDFSEQRRKEFLCRYGIYEQTLWPLQYQPSEEQISTVSPCLEKEFSLLEVHPPPLDRPLNGWKDYYSLRGFPQHSVIAALLHFPLTLYYVITQLLPKDFIETFATIQQSRYVCVHVIGAEKEVEMFQPFLECARLIAPLTLDIHLFGNNFDADHDGQELKRENLHFQIYKGLYHKINHEDIPSPSLAICFNGGIGAYSSYMKTIRRLMKKKTPLYYTDYGQACIMFSKRAISNSKAGVVSPQLINPFRSPLRMVASDQNLPRYSNAYITSIKPFSNSSSKTQFSCD